MKQKCKILGLVLALAIIITGCNIRTQKDDNAVQPGIKNIQAPTTGLPLYFKYKHLPFLSVELRDVTESYDNSIEQLAVNELITGPKNEELERLIPENTIAKVTGTEDTAFVLLSKEFLEIVPGENKNWSRNEQDRAQVKSRRKMAIYSIVNTITELGNYSRVQILISDENNPEGYRPSLYEMGLSDEDNGRFMDILSRDSNLVLSPRSLTTQIFSAIQEKQWDLIFNNITQINSQNPTPITIYEFQNTAQDSGIVMESFTVKKDSTSFTGNSSAIIMVNYTVRNKNNYVREFTNIPIKLTMVNNVWKIEYESIKKILDKGNM